MKISTYVRMKYLFSICVRTYIRKNKLNSIFFDTVPVPVNVIIWMETYNPSHELNIVS